MGKGSGQLFSTGAISTPENPGELMAELVCPSRSVLGEGLVWCEDTNKALYIDIEGKKYWSYDPATKEHKSWDLPERPGCFARTEKGPIIFAFETGLATFDVDTGAMNKFWEFEKDVPDTRMNDGRTDREGRFVVGGYNEKHRANNEESSGVYRMGVDGQVERLLDFNVRVSNSTCFSPDGRTMYFCDSPKRELLAFDYPVDGKPCNQRQFYKMPEGDAGFCDGSTVDGAGGVWSAELGGSRICRHRPEDGKIDFVVKLPVPNPTTCAIGGPDMCTLFITTTRRRMDDEQLKANPEAGGLYAVELPAAYKGLPEPKSKFCP